MITPFYKKRSWVALLTQYIIAEMSKCVGQNNRNIYEIIDTYTTDIIKFPFQILYVHVFSVLYLQHISADSCERGKISFSKRLTLLVSNRGGRVRGSIVDRTKKARVIKYVAIDVYVSKCSAVIIVWFFWVVIVN